MVFPTSHSYSASWQGNLGLAAATVFFFFFPGWGSFRGIWKETSGNNIPELEGIPTLLVASEDAAGVGRQQSRMTRRINCGGRLTFPLAHHTLFFPEKSPDSFGRATVLQKSARGVLYGPPL